MVNAVIVFRHLVPSINEADILIENCLDRAGKLKKHIEEKGVGTDRILEDYFGFSAAAFERAMLGAVFEEIGAYDYGLDAYESIKNDPKAGYPDAELLAWNFNTVILRAFMPEDWTEDDVLYIDREDINRLIERKAFKKRTVGSLHPAVFMQFVDGFSECGDEYIAEEGYPSWFDLVSLDKTEFFEITDKIKSVICDPFKTLLEKAGVTQADVCRRFYISRRTVGSWCSGEVPCRTYLRLLFAEALGLIVRR